MKSSPAPSPRPPLDEASPSHDAALAGVEPRKYPTRPKRKIPMKTEPKRALTPFHSPFSLRVSAARFHVPTSPSRSSRYTPFDLSGGKVLGREKKKKKKLNHGRDCAVRLVCQVPCAHRGVERRRREQKLLICAHLRTSVVLHTGTDSKEAVKNMGQGLDANKDGKVGFEEYLKLVGYLATSLSEQRNVAKEEPAQKAASGQEAKTPTSPDKEAEKPKANAEAKEEVKPGESSEAKVEAKPEANAEAKVAGVAEIKVKGNVGESVEIKLDGEAAAKEGKKAMAGGAILNDLSETPLPVCSKSEGAIDAGNLVSVEKVAAAAEEKVEEKIEEATS
uniref:S100 calcium binding protein U n=1 Tax=Gasterosteus aculeatus aculeatus TaxID=481459 RepID=A0AAQ4Q0N6_GASAC